MARKETIKEANRESIRKIGALSLSFLFHGCALVVLGAVSISKLSPPKGVPTVVEFSTEAAERASEAASTQEVVSPIQKETVPQQDTLSEAKVVNQPKSISELQAKPFQLEPKPEIVPKAAKESRINLPIASGNKQEAAEKKAPKVVIEPSSPSRALPSKSKSKVATTVPDPEIKPEVEQKQTPEITKVEDNLEQPGPVDEAKETLESAANDLPLEKSNVDIEEPKLAEEEMAQNSEDKREELAVDLKPVSRIRETETSEENESSKAGEKSDAPKNDQSGSEKNASASDSVIGVPEGVVTEEQLGLPLISSKPVYPMKDKLRGHQGDVVLRYTVQTDGAVKNIRIYRSSGSKDMDISSAKALASYKYRPSKEAEVIKVFSFRLRGEARYLPSRLRSGS